MSKFRKINKDFILSDSSINCYGFILETAGYQIDQYLKNPIGYYMHERENGVVVRWEDVRIEGDLVLGKPVIDLTHADGQDIADKIENGFLNGASMGSFVILESKEIPHPSIDGETVLCVTKWYNKETSLVDIPGNSSALVLMDASDNIINLSDLKESQIKINNKNGMKKIQLSITPQLIKLLPGLSDKTDVAESDITEGIQDLFDQNTDLSDKNRILSTKNQQLQTKIDAADVALKDQQVTDYLEKALTVDKLITVKTKDALALQFKGNPEGLKDLLATMSPITSVTATLETKETPGDLPALKYTWDDFKTKDPKGTQLANIKLNYPDHFKKIYKDKFGKEFGG